MLARVTDAEGRVTKYAYDNNGNLKEKRYFNSASDAKSIQYTKYQYDSNNNCTVKEDVLDGKSEYTYYTYDEMNNLIGESNEGDKIDS